jgi:hypothetical protein
MIGCPPFLAIPLQRSLGQHAGRRHKSFHLRYPLSIVQETTRAAVMLSSIGLPSSHALTHYTPRNLSNSCQTAIAPCIPPTHRSRLAAALGFAPGLHGLV